MMKSHRLLLGATLLLTPLAALWAQSPGAASNSPRKTALEEAIVLPNFSVSSDRTDGYRATDSLSGARIRTALIDTPATINVITGEFLQDIGANAMFDATQYVAGIGNGRLAGANGIIDRMTIRGFETNGRNTDNFPSTFQANLDPDLIERIEIVKGPNAILAPTGSPGGAINAITKSPLMTPQGYLSLEVGTFNAQKLTVDTTGPISQVKGLAYRMIAAYQNTKTFQPGSLKQWDINPEFSYQISDTSKLSFKYSFVDWAAFGSASSPGNTWIADNTAVNGGYLSKTPPIGFTYSDHAGMPDWGERADKVNRFASELTTSLSNSVSMRLAACFYSDHFDSDSATMNINTGNNRYNPYTGIYTPDQTWALSNGTYVPTFSAEYNPTNVSRTAALQRTWAEDFQLQNDFAGNFRMNGLSLEPVAGWAYQHGLNRTLGKNSPLPNFNLFAQDTNPPKPNYALIPIGSESGAKTIKKQAYAFLRSGLLDNRLFVTLGASRVWLDSINTNELSWASSELKGSKDTYLAGVLYKLAKNLSAYATFSNNANATTFLNQPLWQSGKQYEFGVKSEFFNQRLSLSASHFQVAQTNLVTPNPFFIAGGTQPQNFLSDQTNRGYEFEAVGGLTKELSVIASATTMHLRDAFGRRVRNIPDQTVNALLNYHFRSGELKGASVFLGVTYVGDQAGENPSSSATVLGVIEQVSYYVPTRTIFNAGGSYATGRYLFNLNVDNLLDTHTVWQSSGRNSMSGYPLINCRLTTTVKF